MSSNTPEEDDFTTQPGHSMKNPYGSPGPYPPQIPPPPDTKRRMPWFIVPVLLVILVVFGGGVFVGSKFIGLPTPTPMPPPILGPTDFALTTITQKNGQVLQNQQPVSIQVAELPLTITGTYTSQGSGQVWVVVEDLYGQYYLQTPPVRFADGGYDGRWRASNVDTNMGTTRIDFVSVTSQGNAILQRKMDSKDVGAFQQLPDGYKILLSISIQVTP